MVIVTVSGQSIKTVVVERVDAALVAYRLRSAGLVVIGAELSSWDGATFSWPGELTA
jgi:hypothetical protein